MMTATTASANLASRGVHSSSSRHPHARGLMMKNTTNPKERQLENYLVQRGQFRLLGYRSSPLPNNVITRAQSEADTSTSSFSSAPLSGKGEEASLNSASHGAGRQLSRSKARNIVTRSELKKILRREKVTLIGGGVDEAPIAYKNVDDIVGAQKNLIKIEGKFYPKIVRMDKG